MGKCLYCNKSCESQNPVTYKKESFICCSDECSEKVIEFIKFAEQYQNRFIIFVVLVVPALMLSAMLPYILGYNIIGAILFSLGIAALGLILYLYPFATPQTSKLIGLRNSIKVVKITSIAIMVAVIPLFIILIQ